MKVFAVFVALVGVTFAAICDNVDGKKGEVHSLTADINAFIENNAVLKHCSSIFDDIIAEPACNTLYEEGFCYYNIGAKKYAHVTPENAAETINFEILAEGVPNAMSYGVSLCENARKCSEHVRKVGMECYETPEVVVAVSAEAENLLEQAKDQLRKVINEEPNSMLGRLSKMVYDEIKDKDVDDLMEQGKEQYGKYEDTIMSYGKAALAMGTEFCKKNCVRKTAHALTGLFDSLIQADTCEAPADFCGDCEEAAIDHFGKVKLPCCLKKVIKAALEKFDELKEMYGDNVMDFVEDSLPEEQSVYDSVVEQLECYRNAYENNYNAKKCSKHYNMRT